MHDRIRFAVEGEGPALTLIHGVGADSRSWDAIATALRTRFTVVRMDLRGHGRSAPISGRIGLEDLVHDVRDTLDGADVSRTHLAGFSLGGMIAQQFALTYPDRVGDLILLSTVAGRTEAERQRLAARARRVRAEGVDSVIGASEQRWFTEAFRQRHPEQVAKRLRELRENHPDSYAEAYRVFAESDVGDAIAGIPHRTLIVTGEHDEGSNPRMARFMHERIRDSELVILPGLKHSLLIEAPQQLVELMTRFLDGANAGAGSWSP